MPSQRRKKVELEGLFSSLGASVRNNARPAFPPPIKPAALQRCWDGMEEADRAYEGELRGRLLRFYRADAECASLGAKMANLGAWLEEKEAFFSQEFDGEGAPEAADALAARADAHAQYEKRHAQYDAPVMIAQRTCVD